MSPTPHITLICIKFLSTYLKLLSVLSFQTSWRNSFQKLRPALVWTGFLLTQLWPWDLPYCQPEKSFWCQILGFVDPIFFQFTLIFFWFTLFWWSVPSSTSLGKGLGKDIYILRVSAIHISSCLLELHWMPLRPIFKTIWNDTSKLRW